MICLMKLKVFKFWTIFQKMFLKEIGYGKRKYSATLYFNCKSQGVDND